MTNTAVAPQVVETLGFAALVKGSRGDVYTVGFGADAIGGEKRWTCTCPDFHFRQRACKHMEATLGPIFDLAQQVQRERR